jgi:hypothetical protein
VSAGTLVLNYGTTNVAPTRKVPPLLSSKRRPYFQTRKWSWKEQKFDHGSIRGPKPKMIVLARASTIYWGVMPCCATSEQDTQGCQANACSSNIAPFLLSALRDNKSHSWLRKIYAGSVHKNWHFRGSCSFILDDVMRDQQTNKKNRIRQLLSALIPGYACCSLRIKSSLGCLTLERGSNP